MSKYLSVIKSSNHLCKNNYFLNHKVLQKYFSNIAQTDSSIKPIDSPASNSSVQILENNIDVFLKKDMKIPHALDECQEDVSFISPYIQPTFNFASLANKNKTIQELVKLGVELYKVEAKKGGLELFLKSSFEQDIKPYIQFLNDCGLPAERIANFLTKNPFIIKEDLDDLKTRIRYLRAHSFTPEMIAKIVDVNPNWLSFSTKKIDERLGWFQAEFKLTGNELRQLVVANSRLGTYKHVSLVVRTFCIREEMGFEPWQIKQVLLNYPQLWEIGRSQMTENFDYVHNTMGLSHEILAKQPTILGQRLEKLQQRHKYLVALKRNQYDPTKPLYISPDSIAFGTDIVFCTNVAKTSIRLYDLFLKTL